MDLIDGLKSVFYLIQTCLWLKKGDGSMMIWAEIVDQTLIGLFKLLYNCDVMNKFSLHSTSPSLAVSKWSVYLCTTRLLLIYLCKSVNFLTWNIYWREDNGMTSIKSWFESNQKSIVNFEDEIIWIWQSKPLRNN